jgi:hypothetical protein
VAVVMMMDRRRQKGGGVVGATSEEEVLVPACGIAGRGGQLEEEDKDVGQEHGYRLLLLHAAAKLYLDRSVTVDLSRPDRLLYPIDPPARISRSAVSSFLRVDDGVLASCQALHRTSICTRSGTRIQSMLAVKSACSFNTSRPEIYWITTPLLLRTLYQLFKDKS